MVLRGERCGGRGREKAADPRLWRDRGRGGAGSVDGVVSVIGRRHATQRECVQRRPPAVIALHGDLWRGLETQQTQQRHMLAMRHYDARSSEGNF